MNFSFSGCGFLGIYHVGVAACLKKYAPTLIVNKISGASAGALAAVCLLCDGPLGVITSSVLKTATEARRLFLGPFSPNFNIEQLLRDGLFEVLPADAHKLVSGKLFISVTRVCDGKNVLLSQFETREELIQALLCSAFIPGFSGWMCPTIKGVKYVDGGFTDNCPQLDENTVTVSPLCGEADISPKDTHSGLITMCLSNTSIELSTENLYRFTLILTPPAPEVLSKICQQGFNDALEFLQRNFLINCTRCLAIQSTINMEEQEKDENEAYNESTEDFNQFSRKNEVSINMYGAHDHDDDNCEDCVAHRQEAILDTLPEAVGSILEDAINKANEGLMNWVFKHKSLKIMSILTLPYVIPAEIAYAVFIKLKNTAPRFKDIKMLCAHVLQFLKALIRTWFSKPQPVDAHRHRHYHEDKNFSCQLAITEFTDEGDHVMSSDVAKQKFEFNVDDVDQVDILADRRDSVLESEVLSHLAIRCAAKSRRNSLAPSRTVSRNPSRHGSRAVSRRPSCESINLEGEETDYFPEYSPPTPQEDAFEQILDATSQQDALMAYYYMDENNEMKVTEIFDLSESNVPKPSQNEGNPSSVGRASICNPNFLLNPAITNLRQSTNRRASLNETLLRSHLNSFKDELEAREILGLNDLSSDSSEHSSGEESVISDPEVDQHIKAI